jgi:polyhydroxyalkanoate synthesis regulator phasin
MAQDFESLLREIFGDSWSKLTQFQSDQVKKVTTRFNDLAREALKDELTKLHGEISDLRARVAKLEAERAENAAESVQGAV